MLSPTEQNRIKANQLLPEITHVEGGLAAGQAVECPEWNRCDPSRGSDVPQSIERGDASRGEFEDVVILKAFGDVPQEIGAPDSA